MMGLGRKPKRSSNFSMKKASGAAAQRGADGEFGDDGDALAQERAHELGMGIGNNDSNAGEESSDFVETAAEAAVFDEAPMYGDDMEVDLNNKVQ